MVDKSLSQDDSSVGLLVMVVRFNSSINLLYLLRFSLNVVMNLGKSVIGCKYLNDGSFLILSWMVSNAARRAAHMVLLLHSKM